MAEQLIPSRIVDVEEDIMARTKLAVMNHFESTEAPIVHSADSMLASLLSDPLVFDRNSENRGETADLLWRLGAARNMSKLVLRQVYDVTNRQHDLVHGVDREEIIQSLLKYDPALPHTRGPREVAAFWRLVGWEADKEIDDGEAVMNAIIMLRGAVPMPAALVDQARTLRDSSNTLPHHPKAVQYTNLEGTVLKTEVTAYNEREKELREAQARLLCGAFVAAHSTDEADQRQLHNIIDDFLHRSAGGDITGLDFALKSAVAMYRGGQEWSQDFRINFQTFNQRLGSQVAAFDLKPLPIADVTEVVHAAHHLREAADIPGLEVFVKNGQEILAGYQDFAALLHDPFQEIVIENDAMPPFEEQLAAWRAAEAHHSVHHLLEELQYSEHVPLSVEDVELTLNEGYDYESLEHAIYFIGTQVDVKERDRLTRLFDQVIGGALQHLAPDHPLALEDGLWEFNTYANHAPYLAYFKAGRIFIDGKLRDFTNHVATQLENIQAVTPESDTDSEVAEDSSEEFVMRSMRLINDTLWENRHFYAQGNDPHSTVPAVGALLGQLADFLRSRPGIAESVGVTQYIDASQAEMRKFQTWRARADTIDPQTIVAMEPVQALLSRYTAGHIWA